MVIYFPSNRHPFRLWKSANGPIVSVNGIVFTEGNSNKPPVYLPKPDKDNYRLIFQARFGGSENPAFKWKYKSALKNGEIDSPMELIDGVDVKSMGQFGSKNAYLILEVSETLKPKIDPWLEITLVIHGWKLP